MAIEIKRTPVLQGDAAKAFNAAIEATPKKVVDPQVRVALLQSKKLLANLKGR